MSVLLIADLAAVHDLPAAVMHGIQGGDFGGVPAPQMPTLQLDQPKMLVDSAQALGKNQPALPGSTGSPTFGEPTSHMRRESSTMRNEVNF